MMTRLLASASDTARLQAVVVLPSPARALTTMTVFMPRWTAVNSTLVRSVR